MTEAVVAVCPLSGGIAVPCTGPAPNFLQLKQQRGTALIFLTPFSPKVHPGDVRSEAAAVYSKVGLCISSGACGTRFRQLKKFYWGPFGA